MALFSLYKSNTEYQYEEGKGIASDHTTFHNLGTASGDKTLSSSYTESSLESFAFRANYSYKGRYMATATLRTDGSSRFADGNRWGWFPSVAAAWRISDEAWMKQFNNWLDNAKLRLSYGVTGNNNVGDYVTIASATGPSYVTIDGKEVQGYHPNGLVNTELIWEKVKEFDLGLDLSFLKNRINVTADFYNRLSDGQIMSRSVPIETGEKTSTFNVGSVQNRGIELGLNFNIINKKDFSWSANVNFARNWNKIKELSNGKVDEVANNWFIGEPLNVLHDYTHTDVITDKGVTMHTMNGDKHYTLKELYNGESLVGKPVTRYYSAWYETDADFEAWKAIDPANRANTYRIPMDSQTKEAQNMDGKDMEYYDNQQLVYGSNPCKKFDDSKTASTEKNTCYRDIHIITLPEMYLVAAEAYLKAGSTEKALARLNEVHQRAGLPALTGTITIDDILDENACENFGNEARWMDLRRTQTLVERCTKYNHEMGDKAAQYIGKKLLRPIPQAAIDANDNLSLADQNPGY